MEKGFGQLFEKMKQMKKNQWLVVLLVGVLIIIIAIPVQPDSTENTAEENENNTTVETAAGKDDLSILEERLTDTLSSVNGVGKVKVMLTRKSSGEKIVEKDIPVTDKSTQEEDSEGGNRVTKERVAGEETVYVKDEGGSQTPYVVEEIEAKIEGVVVIAEGGDNSSVVQNITEAVMALFGVEAHKIKVMKMN